MKTSRYLRSTSIRLAVLFAALFACASLVLIGFFWWATAGNLNRSIENRIRTDINVLRQVYRDGGLNGVSVVIRSRMATSQRAGTLYRIADAHLQPIPSVPSPWPEEVGMRTGWHEIDLLQDGDEHRFRVLHAELADGIRVLVGRDSQELAGLRSIIVNAMGWTAPLALILAALVGLSFRRVFLANLRSIHGIADAIGRGDFTRRLPDKGTRDEFDLLAQTLNDMLNRIEELIISVRNVSNAVAHDLRTPLTELRASLEGVCRRYAAVSGVAEGMEEAIADVDQLIAIFTAILRLAEIDSGTRRACFTAIDLAGLVNDACDLYSVLAEAKNLKLTVTADEGVFVMGDRDMMSQLLANILDNAIKFSPDHETITVAVTAKNPDSAEIVVIDRGPGIPDQDLGRVTQRFFRGDSSRHTPGIGLGLSLVQAVADLHHGTLDLSNGDPGLRLCLRLPRQPLACTG